MTGSPSEVCKLERKKAFSPKLASRVGEIEKKNSPSRWIGNKGFFHNGLTPPIFNLQIQALFREVLFGEWNKKPSTFRENKWLHFFIFC